MRGQLVAAPLVVFGLVAVVRAFAACSSTSNTVGPDTPDAAADATSDEPAPVDAGVDSGAIVTFNFTLAGSGGKIAGAQICIHPAKTTCATTKLNGAATLGLPANSQVNVSFIKTGFQSLLTSFTTSDVDLDLDYLLREDALMQTLAQAAGFTLDPSKAIIDAQSGVLNQGAADVVVSVSPSAGKGPVYFDTTSTPAPSLTKTTTTGITWFGEVPPGDYELTFTPPSGSCATGKLGWAGSKLNTSKVTAAAGFLVNTLITCK